MKLMIIAVGALASLIECVNLEASEEQKLKQIFQEHEHAFDDAAAKTRKFCAPETQQWKAVIIDNSNFAYVRCIGKNGTRHFISWELLPNGTANSTYHTIE